jgi:quinol monooxygenase YgiN
MFARIGIFDVSPDKLESVVEHFRIEAVRAFSKHDGFMGYQSFVDRERGRMVGISRWASRAQLDASAESARGVLTQALQLGAVIVGEPTVFEEAFDAAPLRRET